MVPEKNRKKQDYEQGDLSYQTILVAKKRSTNRDIASSTKYQNKVQILTSLEKLAPQSSIVKF